MKVEDQLEGSPNSDEHLLILPPQQEHLAAFPSHTAVIHTHVDIDGNLKVDFGSVEFVAVDLRSSNRGYVYKVRPSDGAGPFLAKEQELQFGPNCPVWLMLPGTDKQAASIVLRSYQPCPASEPQYALQERGSQQVYCGILRDRIEFRRDDSPSSNTIREDTESTRQLIKKEIDSTRAAAAAVNTERKGSESRKENRRRTNNRGHTQPMIRIKQELSVNHCEYESPVRTSDKDVRTNSKNLNSLDEYAEWNKRRKVSQEHTEVRRESLDIRAMDDRAKNERAMGLQLEQERYSGNWGGSGNAAQEYTKRMDEPSVQTTHRPIDRSIRAFKEARDPDGKQESYSEHTGSQRKATYEQGQRSDGFDRDLSFIRTGDTEHVPHRNSSCESSRQARHCPNSSLASCPLSTLRQKIVLPLWANYGRFVSRLFGDRWERLDTLEKQFGCQIKAYAPSRSYPNAEVRIREGTKQAINEITGLIEVEATKSVEEKGDMCRMMFDLAILNTHYSEVDKRSVYQREPPDFVRKSWMSIVTLPKDYVQLAKIFIGRHGTGVEPLKQRTGCSVLVENSRLLSYIRINGENSASVLQCRDLVIKRLAWAEHSLSTGGLHRR